MCPESLKQRLLRLDVERDRARAAADAAELRLRAQVRELVVSGAASIDEVCAWLGVSPQWVHRIIHDEQLRGL